MDHYFDLCEVDIVINEDTQTQSTYPKCPQVLCSLRKLSLKQVWLQYCFVYRRLLLMRRPVLDKESLYMFLLCRYIHNETQTIHLVWIIKKFDEMYLGTLQWTTF